MCSALFTPELPIILEEDLQLLVQTLCGQWFDNPNNVQNIKSVLVIFKFPVVKRLLFAPGEEPFVLVNAYNVHDVSEWKDLNLKFVLQCCRDYALTNDIQYLKDMWPTMQVVMSKALEWDTDNDGVIENSSIPDQTYDTWVMTGTRCVKQLLCMIGYVLQLVFRHGCISVQHVLTCLHHNQTKFKIQMRIS